MAELILLDAESIFAFGSLYPGDISECVKGTYISFGAFSDGKPAALITLEVQDGEMVIDWIYTAPDFRRKGVMTELLEFAIKCMEDGIGPTVVRVFCCDSDIRAFLEKREFYFDAGKAGVTCVSEFGNRKSIKRSKAAVPSRRLAELSNKEIRVLNNKLISAGEVADCVKLPIDASDYWEYSRVCMEDDAVKALILLVRNSDNYVDIAYAFKETGAEMALLNMFCDVWDELGEVLSPDIRIRTVALNEASEGLFEGLFTDTSKETAYMGEKLLF